MPEPIAPAGTRTLVDTSAPLLLTIFDVSFRPERVPSTRYLICHQSSGTPHRGVKIDDKASTWLIHHLPDNSARGESAGCFPPAITARLHCRRRLLIDCDNFRSTW